MKLFGKYEKHELEDLIFNKNLTYNEIGRRYSVSATYIKKVCGKLGITLKKRRNFPAGWQPHNKGKAKTKFCLNCNLEFVIGYTNAKYCSTKCASLDKKSKHYDRYIKNQNEFCNTHKNMRFIKSYILEEQNNCCTLCGMKNEWNGKPITFVLDHIDGNAANNKRENLRLVCPNCDSQLDTYKSKNKNSARKERYLKNYKESNQSY